MNQVGMVLRQFIQRKDPQAIALTGRWGRGKTYFWNALLSDPEIRKVLKQPYSYVSAFGLADLDSFREAVFVNAKKVNADVANADEEGRLSRRLDHATSNWRKLAPFAKHVASYADLGPLLGAVAFSSVRNYLVCIDDLERHSDSLPLKDILGFVSMLREQRSCKILVIFNNDALTKEDFALFAQMREKVFDFEISFEPSARDCASIVFNSEGGMFPEAIECAVGLNITNIRVLGRARSVINDILAASNDMHPALRVQVIRSTILLTWSFNAHDSSVPAFGYLKRLSYGSFVALEGISKPTVEEAAWNIVLEKYDYRNTDELDLHIAQRIEAGYGDASELIQILKNRKHELHRAEAEANYRAAWAIYHGGFGDDKNALVEAFQSSVLTGAQWISANNISSTAQVLRAIGSEALADELIDHWVEVQSETNPKALDLSDSFLLEVKDTQTRERINAKYAELHRVPSLQDVVVKLLNQNGWSELDISVLTAATPEAFERLFLEADPTEVRYMVLACRQFARISNANGAYDVLNHSVETALKSIGGKSSLNRLRVGVYGIELE